MLNLTEFNGHAPGPWKILSYSLNDQDILVCGKIGDWVCELKNNKGKITEEMQVNARLIAAAPDLLAEVKALRTRLDKAREIIRDLQKEKKQGGKMRILTIEAKLAGAAAEFRGGK